jgi:TonB family protein
MYGRSALIALLLASSSLVGPALAFADGPRLVSGGPRAKAARDAALAAVRTAQSDMAPCWRGAPPAEVHVALAVSATGEVVSSTAKVGGPAAQCAAGLLAVAALPGSGERWTGVVVIASGSAPARPAPGGLQAEITQQLGAQRPVLANCQSVDPSVAGDLSLTLAISPAGAIAPTIASSSVSKAIEGCVTGTLRRVTLSLSEKRAARYQLSLSFAGEAQKPDRPGAAPAGTAPVAPALKVGSTLTPPQISEVITARKADFLKCGRTANGTVTIGFTVRPDGTVKNVAVRSSTAADPKLEACLVARLETLRFAASAGESRVTWPFEFRR